MKAIITSVLYSPSFDDPVWKLRANVLYFNGTTFEVSRHEILSVSDIQTNGLTKAAVNACIAYSDSQSWGMTEADIATAQSNVAPGPGDANKYLKGDGTWGTIAGGGDVTGPIISVANEIALFDGLTGKLIKAAVTTGVLKATAGVLAAAVGDTDYALPSTVALKAPLASPTFTGSPVFPAGSISNASLSNADVANLSGTNTGDQTLPVKATGAEVNTGTDDAKFVTAKAMEDSSYVKYVHVSVSSGATTTGANTTPVDVSGAVFTYVQNAIYRIWVMGRINSTAATTGVGIQFNVSTAITAIDVHTTHPLTTATPGLTYSIADDTSAGVSTGVPAGPLDVPFITNALFVPGNNTGTCQLRFRSETTAVTELLAGVTMVVERVA